MFRIRLRCATTNLMEDIMDEKKIEKLYELLADAEKKRDNAAASALRWAIFQLER